MLRIIVSGPSASVPRHLHSMDQICVKCARLSLRVERSLHQNTHLTSLRTFTTTIPKRAEDASKTQGSSTSPTLKITRVPTGSSNGPASQMNSTPRGGQLLRRTGPPSGNQQNRGTGSPQGGFVRHTGQQGQPGQLLRRTGPPRQGARPGASGKPQGPAGKMRRRQTAESVRAREAADEAAAGEEIEDYLTKYIDRPANPTERIAYNPKPQQMSELEKDWPNTPLSATGLSASLIQKIEWLARRLPHGYQTPEQLAEHFQKGNLTRFESEEEKQQVLKIAAELAQKRASMLSERKGSEVATEDMSIIDLNSRDEKKKLVGEVVKGEVKELERQRMPFLESVMRNLRNNETYEEPKMDQFMATVQRLMPAQAQRRPQQQQGQKSA